MNSFKTGTQICSNCGTRFDWRTLLLNANSMVTYIGNPYVNVSESYKFNSSIWRVVTKCPNCSYREIVEISIQGDNA